MTSPVRKACPACRGEGAVYDTPAKSGTITGEAANLIAKAITRLDGLGAILDFLDALDLEGTTVLLPLAEFEQVVSRARDLAYFLGSDKAVEKLDVPGGTAELFGTIFLRTDV